MADATEGSEPDLVASELVVPVYLDTNVLLDLLATVEDGFSLVERVTSEEASQRASGRSGGAEIGTPSTFPFFKLGLSGKLGKSVTEGATATKEVDKTHTYGSLLHRLRRYLVSEGLIAESFSSPGLDVGHFIEFPGVIRPNPFTDSFQRLQRILGFVDVVMGFEQAAAPSQQSGRAKGGQGNRPPQQKSNPQVRQLKAMREFLEHLTSDVEREGTSTVVMEHHQSGYRAVVTLFDNFLRDRSMAEILNREFRVLGKVARHLSTGSTESVDLLASGGAAGFSSEMLGQLASSMGEMASETGMQITEPATTVGPPVIEIIPIAIYL